MTKKKKRSLMTKSRSKSLDSASLDSAKSTSLDSSPVRVKMLADVQNLVSQERNREYGEPGENRGRTAAIMAAYLGDRPGGDFRADDVAAFGIMDTLAHAIAGYVSKASNEAIRQLAIGSLGPLRTQLRAKPLLALIDDQVAGNRFMTSAAFAGAVQNIANPGLAHSLSHYCAMFGVSHGQGCGYFLPLSIRYNKQDDTVSAAYNSLAQEMGFTDQTDLLCWLDELVVEFGLAKGIPSVASWKDQIDHEIFFTSNHDLNTTI